MNFYLIEDYKGKDFLGNEVTIKAGEILPTDGKDRYIVYNDVPICGADSRLARTKFIWADGGDIQERLSLEKIIALDPRIKFWEIKVPVYNDFGEITGYEYVRVTGRYTPQEAKYIRENFSNLLSDDTGIIFNNYFYHGSSLEELRKLSIYLNRQP